jgi:methionyl-tRNA synthetase
MERDRELNRELAAARPWDDVKNGRLAEARGTLTPLIVRLSTAAHWLTPFLPRAARFIQAALAAPSIRRSEPLFPRRGVTSGGYPR